MARALSTSGARALHRKHVMAALVVAGHLGIGCSDLLPLDPSPAPRGHAVRVTATGVLAVVGMELRFGSAFEILTVTQDGAFAFDARLDDGESYTVALVDPPVPCTLQRQTGVITGADAAIDLTCTGASLASLTVAGIPIAFVPGTTEYLVELPLAQQSATITATVATPGDTLTIAGAAVPSGTPSAPRPLNLGDTSVDITVENAPGWQRTYRLTLRRDARIGQYAYAKASNTDGSDLFGTSVALSGDLLAVGAPSEASGATGIDGDQGDDSAEASGAVYVFQRTGSVWQQVAYIKASNTGAGDRFGESVALSGDVLAVGAPREDSAATGIDGDQADDSAEWSGAVYVFRRTGAVWQQEAYIKASNTGAFDRFGRSMALSGDTLVVGAPHEASAATGIDGDQADDSAEWAGAVYVFRRTGTAWQQEAYVKASNTDPDDLFGQSVALSGDTVAVGAVGEASPATGVNGDQGNDYSGELGNGGRGAVYVYRRSGTSWQQEAYVKASNTGIGDRFGGSVALSGDNLAVGASGEDSDATGVHINMGCCGEELDYGAVYMYRRSGTSWQQEAYVKASNTAPVSSQVNGEDDLFGHSVALAGDTLAVGAYLEDSAATGVNGPRGDEHVFGDSGAVYVYQRGDMGWYPAAYVKASNTGDRDHFGTSVALSDDTLAVGAFGESSAATGTGGNPQDDSAPLSGAVYAFYY